MGLISLAMFIVTFLLMASVAEPDCSKFDGGEIDSCSFQGKLHTAAALGSANFAAIQQVQLGARNWPAAAIQDESISSHVGTPPSIRLLRYAPKTSPPRV
jgi:hypothetical protein